MIYIVTNKLTSLEVTRYCAVAPSGAVYSGTIHDEPVEEEGIV